MFWEGKIMNMWKEREFDGIRGIGRPNISWKDMVKKESIQVGLIKWGRVLTQEDVEGKSVEMTQKSVFPRKWENLTLIK